MREDIVIEQSKSKQASPQSSNQAPKQASHLRRKQADILNYVHFLEKSCWNEF